MSIADKINSKIIDINTKLTEANSDLEKILYGIDTGGKSYYEKVWENQKYLIENKYSNTTNNYVYAFAGNMWTNETFKPKYDIIPTSQSKMFTYSNITDIRPETVGVNIDFSKNTNFNQFLESSKVQYTGVIDCSSAIYLGYIFYSATSLVSVEKLILPKEDKPSVHLNTNSFTSCKKLEHIIFDSTNGGIIQTLTFSSASLLDKESIISIIEALSTSVTDMTITFSKTAINNAFGINVDDETTYPAESEYYILRHSRDNWTFNYI